jgi:hypothetical protein
MKHQTSKRVKKKSEKIYTLVYGKFSEKIDMEFFNETLNK